MSYRLHAHISPKHENDLNCDINHDELYDVFTKIKDIFCQFKNVILITIPQRSAFFTNRKLMMFRQMLESDSQINIIFSNESAEEKCNESVSMGVFNSTNFSDNCFKYILKKHSNNSHPILLGSCLYNIYKNECLYCDKNRKCYECFEFICLDFNDIYKFQEHIKSICDSTIKKIITNTEEIHIEDIRSIAFLTALFYGFDRDLLASIKNINIHSDLIRYISNNKYNLQEISFAMLRAISLPSSSCDDRKKFSIDWHRNDPYTINGYPHDLYRVDVVAANKSGVKCSGSKRLLFSKHNDINTFLLYTESHDFVAETIKDRLLTINQ